jgi:MarR family transcriptional regulator, organic hydroperoxide resistance regulator
MGKDLQNMKHTCSPDSLNYLFIQVAKAHRARTHELLSQLGLHVGQEMILVALWMQDGQTLSQLAERLEVQPPTITKMVQRMEVSGIVKREPSREDSRVSHVFLTGKGKNLQAKIEKVWEQVEREFVSELSKEEKLLFQKLLVKAKEGLN